jgi:hypothetical protein
MVRNFSLTPYYQLIEARRAKATVNCLVGFRTRIRIIQLDEEQQRIDTQQVAGYRWSELLEQDTRMLQLTVEFFNPMDDTFSWFRYVELHIEPDMKAPDSHLLYPWTTY